MARKSDASKKWLWVGAVVLLVGALVFCGYAFYRSFHPVTLEHTLYVEVTAESSQEILSDLERANAKKVYVFFKEQNAIPFFFLGRGEGLTRKLVVSDVFAFPVEMTGSVSGNISSFVRFEPRIWRLSPGENQTINVTVEIPKSAVLGNYTGKLLVAVRRS